MFEVDKLSSFVTKLSKNNMGTSWGASDAPNTLPYDGTSQGVSDAPHVIFFQEQKLSFQSNAVFFPRMKITWGASDTTHPSSTTHNIPHQHTTYHTPTLPYHHPHPTTPHPPMEKSGALMPDISWAPPHSLPIR